MSISTKIIQKHSKECEWLISDYTPLQSELIIYDPSNDCTDSNCLCRKCSYVRFKIGDGVHSVNQLPFLSNSPSFVGTMAEYEEANSKGLIKKGTLVCITDDEENEYDFSSWDDFSYFNYKGSRNREVSNMNFSTTKNSTKFVKFCRGASDLRYIPLIDTSKGTTFEDFLRGCESLTEVPLFDFSSGTVFDATFMDCKKLTTIPAYNTAKGTEFPHMFCGCSNLRSIPWIDTSNGYNFNYMFGDCSELVEIPPIETLKGTNFAYMFQHASKVQSIPSTIDTTKGTNLCYMFDGCGIKNVEMNISSATRCIRMFSDTPVEKVTFTGNSGYSLEDATCMFYNCKNLKSVTGFNINNIPIITIDYSYMFYNCINLEEVSTLRLTKCHTENMFYNCGNLRKLDVLDGGTVGSIWHSLNLMWCPLEPFYAKKLILSLLDLSSDSAMSNGWKPYSSYIYLDKCWDSLDSELDIAEEIKLEGNKQLPTQYSRAEKIINLASTSYKSSNTNLIDEVDYSIKPEGYAYGNCISIMPNKEYIIPFSINESGTYEICISHHVRGDDAWSGYPHYGSLSVDEGPVHTITEECVLTDGTSLTKNSTNYFTKILVGLYKGNHTIKLIGTAPNGLNIYFQKAYMKKVSSSLIREDGKAPHGGKWRDYVTDVLCWNT